MRNNCMLVYDEELLNQLKAEAGRPMTRDEVRAQKISFVMSMISKNNDMTREEVAALIDRTEGTNDWQPIETAPKDGTPVLLHHGGCTVVGFFEKNHERWENGYEWCDGVTHWMPLPSDPEV